MTGTRQLKKLFLATLLTLIMIFSMSSNLYANNQKIFEKCTMFKGETEFHFTYIFDEQNKEVEELFYAQGEEYINFLKIIKDGDIHLETEIFSFGTEDYAMLEFNKTRDTINLQTFSDRLGKERIDKIRLFCSNVTGQWKPRKFEKNDNIITTDDNYFALIIGNNNYQHLTKLDAAVNDARVLSNVLEKNYGFNVELLLNANYDEIVNSLHLMSKKLSKKDNLLIFYAGHGELDTRQNRGYWLPVDAQSDLRSKWISNAIVADELKATQAKHVLLIVDSCFSGSLMRDSGLTNRTENLDKEYINLLKRKKTRIVITSGGNEPVIDSDGGDHSIFAKKLIDSLKDNKKVISTQQLFENIRKYVAVNANQTPERAAIYQAGHDGGDFLFFSKK